MRKSSIGEYCIAGILVIIACGVILSTVMHMIGIQSEDPIISRLLIAGQFLFISFHIGAYIIGIYFFGAAALTLTERSKLPLFTVLFLLSLPILSFSLGMKILFSTATSNSPIVEYTIDTFGRRGGLLISFLLTAATFVLIFQFRDHMIGEHAQKFDRVKKREKSASISLMRRQLREEQARVRREHNPLKYQNSAPFVQVNNGSFPPQVGSATTAQSAHSIPHNDPSHTAEHAEAPPYPPDTAAPITDPYTHTDDHQTVGIDPADTVVSPDTTDPVLSTATYSTDQPARQYHDTMSMGDTLSSPAHPEKITAKIYGQYEEDLPAAIIDNTTDIANTRAYDHEPAPTHTSAHTQNIDTLTHDRNHDNAHPEPGDSDNRRAHIQQRRADTPKHHDTRRADIANEEMPRFILSDGSIYADDAQSPARATASDRAPARIPATAPDHAPTRIPSTNDASRITGYTIASHDPTHTRRTHAASSAPSAHDPIPMVSVGPHDWHLDADRLLKHYPSTSTQEFDRKSQQTAHRLKVTLQEFKIDAEIVGIRRGPVVTVYELLPARGVKVSSISNLSDNIALRLAAERVRIVAPIPGKHAVGIELPNKDRHIVGFDTLVTDERFSASSLALPIALGRGMSGEAEIFDLTQTPHLLIAGATGSGKSVCVNSIICSLMFRCSPHDARMLLIDPKIIELKAYNGIPHLITPVITDTKRAAAALNYCVSEMERRYELLDEYAVRDIRGYNQIVDNEERRDRRLPYLIVIIDEFADLILSGGKQIEITLSRLAAMARAVGIHLVLATQRPSADVITGLIKANIPTRIAFMVSSKVDSRIILDIAGAEQLLGKGDMLFASSWDPNPVRIQGALVTDSEVLNVAGAARDFAPPNYIPEREIFGDHNEDDPSLSASDDPLYQQALDIVMSSGKASASFLQRRLQIGYNRAARIVEEMEQRGIIGPANGSKARELIIS